MDLLFFTLISVVVVLVVGCSVSYIHQQDIHHSEVDVKTSQEQTTDISPPSMVKDISKGVVGIARAVIPPPAAPPVAPVAPADDAARARDGA